METAYEVFDCYSGQTIQTFRTEAQARHAIADKPQQDYQPVRGFWQDEYNDYSVRERFIVRN